MNNLIQELENQCVEKYTTYFDGRGNVTETSFNRYKFAELIVQECLLAISKTDVTLEEMPVLIKCHSQVEKHFGVES